jgi:hypothetical protein
MSGREFSWKGRSFSIEKSKIESEPGGKMVVRMAADTDVTREADWPDELMVLDWLKKMFGSEMAIVGVPTRLHKRERVYRIERL